MKTQNNDFFTAIKVEGALLSSDILRRISIGDPDIEGLKPADYNLPQGERINEAVSRSWSYLLGRWHAFQDKRKDLPQEESGRGLTREQFLLPLFKELDFGRLQTTNAVQLDNKEYHISHLREHVPIHLMGCGVDLDRKKKGEPGASTTSPHSLVQEFLNRSQAHLWGIVANGLKLRLLRDNVSLTRQAYIEFDLEAIMDGQIYSDFLLLWLLCHQSRLEHDNPEECWLEKWHLMNRSSGVRILDDLRQGVERAISIIGQGFLTHKANALLRNNLQDGSLTTMDYYRQLLRLVYRLIFLLVAESRDLLLLPRATTEQRDKYQQFYSISRLRLLSETRRGGSHPDLWLSVKLLFELLGKDQGFSELGLPALGSFLWSKEAVAQVADCQMANRDLLNAIYYLSFVIDNNVRQKIDYKNLGPEELGSVYEALLELYPIVNITKSTFELKAAGGSERKTSGSYYTPTSLIASLLDTALEPILKEKNSETQILALKVCDPACGSGHFLLAAAHRIAKKLASIRTQEPEPPPDFLRSAIRDVIGHCIYGVDINPMSVELCKVSLWMEALEPGKPLSFLDHRILCGNSLIGVYPALMELGIPDDAFTPIEGDDKKICQKYKTLNRKERGTASPRSLFDAAGEKWFGSRDLSNHFMNLDDIDDSTINGYHRKAETYHNMLHSANYQNNKLIADVWCAAFVWKKIETEALLYPIHQEVFQQLRKNPTAIPGWMKQEINRLAEQYRFFHFHLAFPDVFRLSEEGEESMNLHTGWHGGFDVVLGNPPWERIKLQEKEWFASRCPDIANAANASNRQKMIENLAQNDPFVYNAFIEERRKAEGESHFIRNSTKFPLCGRGDVNTFSIFTETNREIISPVGRVGCIVPSGIATDDTTKFFFQDIVSTRTLVSLYDFENRNAIFPGVHRSYKFCLLTLTGRKRPNTRGAEFIFFALSTSELRDKERLFTLTADEIALVNPNTRTCPIFRYQRDAKLVKKIYQEVPILMAEEESVNPWQVKFLRMLDMANDSNLFRTKDELLAEGWELSGNVFKKDSESFYPLYEAKMFHHFNYRFGSFDDLPKNDISAQLPIISPERLKSPYFSNFPRYWIEKKEILSKFIKYPHLNKNCFLSLRKICRNNDERSVIASVLPFSGVSDSSNLFLFNEKLQYTFVLSANLSSFILDFVARLKMGGTNLNFFIFKQFPVLPPETYSIKTPWHTNIQLSDWIKPYVLELTYTAWDLEPFARDCGYDGPPFIWDEERRFLLRCELDAAYFHLYGIKADDVDYIMETFPIVKRKDEKAFGSFRTKDKILEIYRHMAAAIQNEKPYQTQLNPPPADEQVAHKNHKTIS